MVNSSDIAVVVDCAKCLAFLKIDTVKMLDFEFVCCRVVLSIEIAEYKIFRLAATLYATAEVNNALPYQR